MPVMDVAAAKKDGYSDEEILSELQRRSGVKMDVQSARADGYTVEEIAQEVERRVASPVDDGKRARAEALREQARGIETGSTAPGAINQAGGFVRDLAAVGTNAVAGIADAAGGVQGLLTGNFDNALRRSAAAVTKFSDEVIASPELRKEKQSIADEVASAKGDGTAETLIAKAAAQIKGLATNPLAAADFVGTQAAQLLLPAQAAKLAVAGATKLGAGASAAAKAQAAAVAAGKGAEEAAAAATAAKEATRAVVATMASVGAGAGIQGGSVGGETYDDLMSPEMDEKWGSLPEYQERIAKGEDAQDVKESIATRYAVAAGGIGALTSVLFNGSEALRTTERVIAGAGKAGAKTVPGKIALAAKNLAAESLVSEPGEEATGLMAKNNAVRNVDSSRGITEGLGETVASAMLGGAMMGGVPAVGEAFVGGMRENDAGQKVDATVLDKADPVAARNLAQKAARLDNEFSAVVQAKPELAEVVDSWRKENPLGEVDAFEAQVQEQEDAVNLQAAMESPKVQQAQQQAQQAQETLQAAQAVATADPTQAPAGGITPADARDILKNGTKKQEQAAQAAEETVRTQIQTVQKQQETDSVASESVSIAQEATKKVDADAKAILKESQTAMLAGSKPFDFDLLVEQGISAGLPEEAARDRAGAIEKKIRDKQATEQTNGGKGASNGSTPAASPSSQPAPSAGSPAMEGTAVGAGTSVAAAPPEGVPHEAVTARGTRGKYRLRVVPLASLVSSDMAGYPPEVQPRDRSRHQANETVRRIGRDLNPDLLMPTPSVTDGPPVIGDDMVVEGGNGRVMGMRLAAKNGSAGWRGYQAAIRSRAEEFGVDPAALDGMTDPVLVRVRDFGVKDRAEFARELNESATNSMDASSVARADAARMTPAILGLIAPEAVSLRDETMADFLNAFIQKVVPEGERAAMRDPQGAPAVPALVRAQAALFAKAYGEGDSKSFREVLASSVEETDPDGKNILSGLQMAAAAVARLSSIPGAEPYSIGLEIMDAVALVNGLRARGVSLRDHLKQVEADIFGHKIAEEVVAIAKTVSSMVRSGRKIGETIREYTRIAEGAIQADMFSAPPTKLEAWAVAAKEVSREAEGEQVPPAPALETGTGGGNAQEGPRGALEADPEGTRPQGQGAPGLVAPSAPSSIDQDVQELIRISRSRGKAASQERFAQIIEERGLDEQGAAELVDSFRKALKANPVSVGKVGDALLERMRDAKELPKDNRELKKLVTEIDGTPPDALRMKEAQEEWEAAAAMWARELIAQDAALPKPAGSDIVFAMLLDAYKSQPNLAIRTSTSMENQAYSTPLPLSYLANLLAGMNRETTVYEPTAGNGLLLLNVDPANVAANELDPKRFRRLQAQGFARLRNGDATTAALDGFVADASQDAVIANPPFGAITEDGEKVTRELDGYQIKKIDHLIVGQALAAMKPDGRATLIIAASKEAGGLQEADRIFFNWLYSHYNVVDHFEVEGDFFSRQGAGWPVRIISVHGRVDSEELSPEAGTVPRFTTWEEIHAHVRTVLGSEAFRRPPARRAGVASPDGRPGDAGGSAGTSARSGVRGDKRGEGSGGRGGNAPGTVGPADVVQPGAATGGSTPDGRGQGVPAADRLPEESGGESDAGAGVGAGGAEAVVRGVGGELHRPHVERRIVETDTDSVQTKYSPSSHATPLDEGILVPTNMAQPLSDAMTDLQNAVGDIDTYVANELGYSSVEEMRGYFMGTQTDGIASMIHQARNGRAVVIADQTGVGKGRQAAAMIRWAIKEKKIPVFVTVDTKLFTAMWNDLADIGSNDVAPFLMNSEASVFAADGKTAIVSSPKNRSKLLTGGVDGFRSSGMNAVFTTYSQFRIANAQRSFLQEIARDAVVIMDESHNAAGQSATGEFFQGIVAAAGGVTYLSATWAKRPDNLPVYSRTDVGAIGMSAEDLESAIVRGGYPLQAMISSLLTRSGQMFRRERSFEGVSFETIPMVNRTAEHEAISDAVTEGLRAIMAADRTFHEIYVKSFAKAMSGEKVADRAGNKVSAGSLHVEFSSVVHNFVRQMSLAMKADEVVEECERAIQRGEAPIVGLESTMGSFLEEFAAKEGLKYGDSLGAFGWRNILFRALERSRYVSIKDAKGNSSRREVSMEELDPATRAAYRRAEKIIEKLEIDLPASPIDWIRQKLAERGYKVAEVTGRTSTVDYSDPKNPRLAPRLDAKADQVRLVSAFNTGGIDAMILNVSGATGISMHSDARWTDAKNPRRRVMIIAQPMSDINIFMQLLGRVHRTGQIVPPAYKLLALNLPSEIRPMAALTKKMKSLNANTSADTKGNTNIDAVDILNQYGSLVVNEYLLENPALENAIGVETVDGEESKPDVDFAQKVTGRLATLPVAQQRAFWSDVIPRYNALIDYLNQAGENKLVRRTLDWRAQEVSRQVIYQGNGSGGAFSGPAYLLKCEVRADGRPLTPAEAQKVMDDNLGGVTPFEHRAALVADVEARFQAFKAGIDPESEGAFVVADRIHDRFKSDPPPKIGTSIAVNTNDVRVTGVVVGIEADIRSGNPCAPSKFKLQVATNSRTHRMMKLPLSKYRRDGMEIFLTPEEALEPSETETTTRYMVVGNILGGFSALQNDVDGEVITTTLANGETIDALRLPNNFDAEKGVKEDVLVEPAEAARVLERIARTSRPFLVSKDGNATFRMRGQTVHVALSSKKRDTVVAVSRMLGIEFANGEASIPLDKASEVLARMPITASRVALEETGLLKGGAIDPAGFARPESFETITENHVRTAGDILQAPRWETERNINDLREWVRSSGEVADLTGQLERLADGVENGTATVRDGREVFRKLREKANATGSALDTTPLMRVAGFMARATMAQKAKESGVTAAIPWEFFNDQEVTQALARLYPFILERQSEEMRNAVRYAMHCFSKKTGSLPNLSSPKDRKAFKEYLNGEMRLQSSPAATYGAMAAGLLGMGVVSPGFAVGAVAAIAAWHGMKGVSWVWDKVAKPAHSPRSRIMTANSSSKVSGQEIVDMLDQVYLRGIEIAAPAQAVLRQMQALAASMEIPIDQVGRALADVLEGGEVPPGMEQLAEFAIRLRGYFEKRIIATGGKTIEHHFHRVYDFDGLQALKADPQALSSVARSVAEQIIENDRDRVEQLMEREGMTEAQAAYTLAVNALGAIYDGSDEAKAKKASQRAKEQEEFILAMLSKGDGAAVSYAAYARVKKILDSRVSPFRAAGTKARKLSFQLPESVKLSNGNEVRLVDRDFFSVYPKYIDDMSRSLAQAELLEPRKLSQFLNGIGPVDDTEREEIEGFIRDDLSHRTRRSFETLNVKGVEVDTRKWVIRIKNANSIRFLAMNVWYPARNILFGSALTLGLTGLVPWLKAGAKLAKSLVPWLRAADVDKASVAGAIMQQIVDDHLHSTGRTGRLLSFPMLYSQQAVDVAGFYAGRYYAPTVLDMALHGRGEKQSEGLRLLKEALGEKRAEQVLDDGAFTNDDLDRFGLVYRNMISGTGRNFNLPKFMGSEMGKFLFQFSSIPAEQTKLYVDRIMGTRREGKYWTGAAFAGAVLLAAQWAAQAAGRADDDEEEKKLAWFDDWSSGSAVSGKILYMMAQSGSFQRFGPIWSGIIPTPSGYTPDAANTILQSTGIGPLATSGGSLLADMAKGIRQGGKAAELEDDPIDILTVSTMPATRNIVNQQTSLLRSFGFKLGRSTAEEDLSGR